MGRGRAGQNSTPTNLPFEGLKKGIYDKEPKIAGFLEFRQGSHGSRICADLSTAASRIMLDEAYSAAQVRHVTSRNSFRSEVTAWEAKAAYGSEDDHSDHVGVGLGSRVPGFRVLGFGVTL